MELNRPSRTRTLLLVALLVALIGLAVRQTAVPNETPSPTPITRAPPSGDGDVVVFASRSGALVGAPPSDETLAAAHEHLRRGGLEVDCGPYTAWSDVHDEALIAGCRRAVAGLDDTYERRFGIRPTGRPTEAIFLFADLESYRAFAALQGMSSFGYSAHSIPARGYVAVWVGDRPHDEVVSSIVHELGHVLNRRALGTGLPRWLEEGLADGLGDSATAAGIGPLEGAAGAEGQLERLKGGYSSGRVAGARELISREDREFDRGTISYDYELSAFLVRYLLSEPGSRDRFRTLLADLAEGANWTPDLVPNRLGVSWDQLDHGLEMWVSVLD